MVLIVAQTLKCSQVPLLTLNDKSEGPAIVPVVIDSSATSTPNAHSKSETSLPPAQVSHARNCTCTCKVGKNELIGGVVCILVVTGIVALATLPGRSDDCVRGHSLETMDSCYQMQMKSCGRCDEMDSPIFCAPTAKQYYGDFVRKYSEKYTSLCNQGQLIKNDNLFCLVKKPDTKNCTASRDTSSYEARLHACKTLNRKPLRSLRQNRDTKQNTRNTLAQLNKSKKPKYVYSSKPF